LYVPGIFPSLYLLSKSVYVVWSVLFLSSVICFLFRTSPPSIFHRRDRVLLKYSLRVGMVQGLDRVAIAYYKYTSGRPPRRNTDRCIQIPYKVLAHHGRRTPALAAGTASSKNADMADLKSQMFSALAKLSGRSMISTRSLGGPPEIMRSGGRVLSVNPLY
jgi:hypothetical protein